MARRKRKGSSKKKMLTHLKRVFILLLAAAVCYAVCLKFPVRWRKIFGHGKPRLALVIDDVGYTLSDRDLLRSLGPDVTYAVLPLLPNSRFFGLLHAETKAGVILHQPLESESGTIPGPGLITGRMPPEQVLDVLRRSLASVPYVRGINNHMGSLGTSEPQLMKIILAELHRRKLFFLDSRTTPKSVGWKMARKLGVAALERDVFLDNSEDPAAIRRQLRKLQAIARKKGYAIGIGHYHHSTLTVLNEEIPKLKKAGFKLVSLEDIR